MQNKVTDVSLNTLFISAEQPELLLIHKGAKKITILPPIRYIFSPANIEITPNKKSKTPTKHVE